MTAPAKIKDTIGKAAALLAMAPAFVEGAVAQRRTDAAAMLATLGLDPAPGAVDATVAQAAELLRARAAPATSHEPLLKRFKDVTGWSDHQLAKALSMTRASVQAYASGRSPERLSDVQKNVLLAGLKRRATRMAALIAEMER